MSSTILMAIVLVVMWLVVLVPMFVRRHDDRSETRSMDRFATAMRVLSRRTPGTGGVVGRRRLTTTPVPYGDGTPGVRGGARARMLHRRRRTLAVLEATALLGAPAALLVSSWLWLAQVPAALLLAGYVGLLRQQVRLGETGGAAGPCASASRARRPDPAGAAERAGRGPNGGTVPVEAGEAVASEDRGWQPVAVPTPTYVTAPVVRRGADSLVDLDDDDLSFADFDPYADAVDRRRAVNE